MRIMQNRLSKEWACSGIYCIQNILTGKRYIGSSVDIRRRITEHRGALRYGQHPNPYLQSSFSLHGEGAFIAILVERTNELQEREKYWIDFYQCYVDTGGYNIEAPYRGPILEETKQKISIANTGKKRTEEMRKKASEQRKGQEAWNKGLTLEDPRVKKYSRKPGEYHHSIETRKKISQNRKGIIPSTVPRGYKLSEEFCKKNSAARKKFYSDPDKRKEQSDRMKQWWAERKKISE